MIQGFTIRGRNNMFIKNVIRRWSIFALGISCILSFQGSIFAAQQKEMTVDTSQKVEINWYFIGNGPQKDTKLVENEINKYIAEHTDLNCTLKLNCFDWGTYNEHMEMMITQKENFDICFTSYWANDYYKWASKGAFYNLDEVLPTYAPKTQAILGEDCLKGAEINGKLYAIPCNQQNGAQYGLVVREDLVKKYHMDLSKVKSLKDMEPFFEIIKKQEPHMNGLVCNNFAIKLLPYEYIMDDNVPGAVEWGTSNYKVINPVLTEEAINQYRVMHQYYLKWFIKADCPFSDWEYTSTDGYKDSFAIIELFYPGKLQYLEEDYGYKYIHIPFTQPYMERYEPLGSMLAISKTSRYPERALILLEQIYTDPELTNLINFGIEGLHYKVVGKSGNIKIMKTTQNTDRYNVDLGWALGNQFLNNVYENQDPDIWDKLGTFNKQTVKSKILGFHFDPSRVSKEVEACQVVYDNYVPQLATGLIDPDTNVPKMEKAFKAAGADKVIAEMQRQLDEWRTNVK